MAKKAEAKKMDQTKGLHMLAFILVVVGALNIGLSALGYNVLEMLFGAMSTVKTVIYLGIGVSAVYLLATHGKDCLACKM